MSEADARDLVAFAGSVGSEGSVEELVQNDIEFHHRIAEASGNPVLCSLIDSLSRPTQRARVWRGLTQGDARTRTLAEHHAIADAILRRQPALARAWATVHVAGVEEWLRQALTN
jgi:DNA-binding FadR family transcriptional regulator